jgi:hypothetical protein
VRVSPAAEMFLMARGARDAVRGGAGAYVAASYWVRDVGQGGGPGPLWRGAREAASTSRWLGRARQVACRDRPRHRDRFRGEPSQTPGVISVSQVLLLPVGLDKYFTLIPRECKYLPFNLYRFRYSLLRNRRSLR